ncbi:MAG: hypothetical protein QW303_04895, partial [Nitrososphaerota archaeon]
QQLIASKSIQKSIPPSGWNCSSSYYEADDGCDCNCGAWDPDCVNSTAIFGCYEGPSASCEQPGVCKYGSVPVSWTCNVTYYGTNDGCDCSCGAYDPDCSSSDIIFGCQGNDTCDNNGNCVAPTIIPDSWICAPEFYAAQDGCDCNCGVADPDCDTDTDIYGCPCTNMECSTHGFCIGECNGVTIKEVNLSNQIQVTWLFILFIIIMM